MVSYPLDRRREHDRQSQRGRQYRVYRGPDKSGAVYEHIGVGAEGEGYVLCYNTPSGQVNTFDTGVDMSGWGAPTFASLSATQSRVVARKRPTVG